MELEGEHAHPDEHQHGHAEGRRQHGLPRKGDSVALGDPAQRGAEERRGRGRKAQEFVALRVVDIEACQAQGRAGRKKEDQQPDPRRIGQHEGRCTAVERIEHGRGGKSEGDVVGQRIELQTDGRALVQQTRRKPVEEVEHRGQDNQSERQAQVAVCQGRKRCK